MRRITWLSSIAATVLFVGAGLAWACTPQAWISISPRSGPGGSRAVVDGGGFGKGTVEIRWNSSEGEVLATPTGPNFTASVMIPQVPEGTYTVLAAQSFDSNNLKTYRARAAFTVTSGSSSQTSGQGTRSEDPENSSAGSSGGGSTEVSGGSSGTTSGSTSGADDQGSRSGSTTGTGNGGSGPDGGSTSATVQGGSSSTEAGPSRSDDPSKDRQPSSQEGYVPRARSKVLRSESGTAGSVRSVAPSSRQVVARSDRAGGGADRSTVSSGTVSGDLWSGFTSGSSVSLIDGLPDDAEDRPDQQLSIAVALLGSGVLLLLGGLLVVTVQRRRVVVRTR